MDVSVNRFGVAAISLVLGLACAGCGSGEAPAASGEPASPAGPAADQSNSAVAPNMEAFLTCLAQLTPCGEVGEGESAVAVACTEDIARCAQSSLPQAGGASSGDGAGTDGGADAVGEPAFTLPCLSDESAQKAMGTVQMLVALQELMADYRADSPPVATDAPTACVTSVAAANDPALARGVRDALAEVERRNREAASAAEEARRAFEARASLAWTWDPQWETRQRQIPSTGRCMEVNGCRAGWDGPGRPSSVSPAHCYGSNGCYSYRWEEVTPARQVPMYDRMPELVRRVAESNVSPGVDAFCVVEEAERTGEDGVISCSGLGRVLPSFRIVVPRAAVDRDGPLGAVGIGDLVRVVGHGAVIRVEENDSGRRRRVRRYWQIQEVPAAGVSIVERSACCAVSDTGGGNGSGPPAEEAAGEE